ncbi:hypothetical protein VrSk94_28190 [Vibrio rotiferianus]
MLIPRQHRLSIEKLIELILNKKHLGDGQYCIYTKDSEARMSRNLVVYIDNYLEEDAGGGDLFSDFVVSNELELYYYGEQFIDVVNNAIHQKQDATIDELVEAGNFYLENDNFITF